MTLTENSVGVLVGLVLNAAKYLAHTRLSVLKKIIVLAPYSPPCTWTLYGLGHQILGTRPYSPRIKGRVHGYVFIDSTLTDSSSWNFVMLSKRNLEHPASADYIN